MRWLAVIALVAPGCGSPAPTPPPVRLRAPTPVAPTPIAAPPAPVAASPPAAVEPPPAEPCGPSTVGPVKPGGTVRFSKGATKPGTTGIPGVVRPRPMLVHGRGTVVGGYDVALVRRYLRRQGDRYTACYEEDLLRNSDLAGEVILRFTIGGDGKVTQACARGITSGIEACMATLTNSLSFPAPPDAKPVEVTYPLELTGEYP